jgi:hypothetical protein
MTPKTVEERVLTLETEMDGLRGLPAKVDALGLELSQFRKETRVEFSAVRAEIKAVDDGLRSQIQETCRQMRVLHEDVIARLALIQEGQPKRRRRKA